MEDNLGFASQKLVAQFNDIRFNTYFSNLHYFILQNPQIRDLRYLIPVQDNTLVMIGQQNQSFWEIKNTTGDTAVIGRFYQFFTSYPFLKPYFWTVTFSNFFFGLIDDFHQNRAVAFLGEILKHQSESVLKEEFYTDFVTYFIWNNRVFQSTFQSEFFAKFKCKSSENTNSDYEIKTLAQCFIRCLNRLSKQQIEVLKQYVNRNEPTSLETRKTLFLNIIIKSVSIWQFSPLFIANKDFQSGKISRILNQHLEHYPEDPDKDIFFGPDFQAFLVNPSYFYPITLVTSINGKMKPSTILSKLDIMILIQILHPSLATTQKLTKEFCQNKKFNFDESVFSTELTSYAVIERAFQNNETQANSKTLYRIDNSFHYMIKYTKEISSLIDRLYCFTVFDREVNTLSRFQTYLNDTVLQQAARSLSTDLTPYFPAFISTIDQLYTSIMQNIYKFKLGQNASKDTTYKVKASSTQHFCKWFDLLAHELLFSFFHTHYHSFNVNKTQFPVVNQIPSPYSLPTTPNPISKLLQMVMNQTRDNMFPNNQFDSVSGKSTKSGFRIEKIENSDQTIEMMIDQQSKQSNSVNDDVINDTEQLELFSTMLSQSMAECQVVTSYPEEGSDEQSSCEDDPESTNNDDNETTSEDNQEKQYGFVDLGLLLVVSPIINELLEVVSGKFDGDTLINAIYSYEEDNLPISIMQGPIAFREALTYAEKELEKFPKQSMFRDVYDAVFQLKNQFSFDKW